MTRFPLSSSLARQAGFASLAAVFAILVVVFVFWCALGNQGDQRMSRVCSPLSVAGNLSTSFAAVVYDGAEIRTKQVFDDIVYSCKYMVWRLAYEKDWQTYADAMTAAGRDPFDPAYYGAPGGAQGSAPPVKPGVTVIQADAPPPAPATGAVENPPPPQRGSM